MVQNHTKSQERKLMTEQQEQQQALAVISLAPGRGSPPCSTWISRHISVILVISLIWYVTFGKKAIKRQEQVKSTFLSIISILETRF